MFPLQIPSQLINYEPHKTNLTYYFRTLLNQNHKQNTSNLVCSACLELCVNFRKVNKHAHDLNSFLLHPSRISSKQQ